MHAGGGGGGRGNGAGSAATPATFAERQIQRQQADAERRAANERKKAQELQAEVRRLQRELSAQQTRVAADGEGDDDDVDMDLTDGDFTTWTDEARQARIDIIRGGLPYLEAKYGVDSEEVAQAKSEVETIQRASREAKPYRTHRAQLERRKNRLQGQQDRDEEEVQRLQMEIDAAKEKLAKVQTAVEERTKEIDKVDAELKELLRRALAEDAEAAASAEAPKPAPAPRAEAWGMVEATLAEMATGPGLPAEQAQQMSAFLELFRQVATNVLAAPGGATKATPPSCGPRWAATATKKAQAAAAATAQQKGDAGKGGQSGNVEHGAVGQSGQQAPQVPIPAAPPLHQTHGSEQAGASTSTSSSSGGITTGLGAIPSVLSPHLSPTSGHVPRNVAPRGATEGADASANTGRRQRSNSCSREARKAEAAAARTAAAQTNGSGEHIQAAANEQAAAAAEMAGTRAEDTVTNDHPSVHRGADAQAGSNREQVHIGTDESGDDAMGDDIQLWSDADGEAAEVDDLMGRRDGETEADRRARISNHVKERLQIKARERRARKEAGKASGGVRKPQKGA